jgi:hypothetical protein
MISDNRPKYAAGKSGKYTCTRCGWKWTPRVGCPDPPRACARCRSAYWQTAPMSSRANSPEDSKWHADRDLVARRRRERHLAKLRELAAEFGLEPPPIEDVDTMHPAEYPPRPAAPSIELRDRFNERVPAQQVSGPTIPPVRNLSLEQARLTAQSESKSVQAPPLLVAQPSQEPGGLGQSKQGIVPIK